jgi:ribosome-binding factor A
MSQRVAKVESLLQHVVAVALSNLLEKDAASATVTRVDASPDLRNANVWIGLLGPAASQERIWARIEGASGQLQGSLSGKFTMKFVPRLHLKRDTGGEYAAEIDRLLRKL